MATLPTATVNSGLAAHVAPPSTADATATTTGTTDATETKVEAPQADAAVARQEEEAQAQTAKWPGWPGDNVFRLIVPVLKVGSIIGRKGELVKKMCDETRARIRILEGPLGNPDRVVLISGKEEPETPLSPAMDAVIRVFKRVSGLSVGEGDIGSAAAGVAFCSIKLLVASSQAINLIGKQGSTIRSIQENTGASVRVLTEDEGPSYAASEERVVEIQGEAAKVLKALEAVIGQLRKFLVDHSVIPIFEKSHNATISQERLADTMVDKTKLSLQSAPALAPASVSIPAPPTVLSGGGYSFSLKRDPSLYDHEGHLEPKISQSGVSIYEQDPVLSGLRSAQYGRAPGPVVTQMTQTMQVPLSYAEDIIGVGGSNIAYIRKASGAILSIQEINGNPDDIIIEIKGSTSQVRDAQQLIQEFINNHKEPVSSLYGKIEPGMSSAYTQLSESSYPSSSFTSHLGGGYGSSSLGGGGGGYGSPGLGGGGYNSFRY